MRLSTHFSLAEFTRSQTAARYNLSNEPSADEIQNLRIVAFAMEILRAMCDHTPISPDSVFRSQQVNKKVGGTSSSRHTRGLAIDFTVPGYTVKQIFDMIAKSDIPFHKVINEYDSWIHWSFPALGESAQRLGFIKDNSGYRQVTI